MYIVGLWVWNRAREGTVELWIPSAIMPRCQGANFCQIYSAGGIASIRPSGCQRQLLGIHKSFWRCRHRAPVRQSGSIDISYSPVGIHVYIYARSIHITRRRFLASSRLWTGFLHWQFGHVRSEYSENNCSELSWVEPNCFPWLPKRTVFRTIYRRSIFVPLQPVAHTSWE